MEKNKIGQLIIRYSWVAGLAVLVGSVFLVRMQAKNAHRGSLANTSKTEESQVGISESPKPSPPSNQEKGGASKDKIPTAPEVFHPIPLPPLTPSPETGTSSTPKTPTPPPNLNEAGWMPVGLPPTKPANPPANFVSRSQGNETGQNFPPVSVPQPSQQPPPISLPPPPAQLPVSVAPRPAPSPDQQMARLVVGTWWFQDDDMTEWRTFNGDNSFSVVREYRKPFKKLFSGTVRYSGRWNLQNSILVSHIGASSESDLGGQVVSIRIVSLDATQMIYVDQFGNARRIPRIR